MNTTSARWPLTIESALSDNHIRFVDTTLRDGEQTAGVVFSDDEKLHIAHELDTIGIDRIEAGVPIMGHDDFDFVEQLAHEGLHASILGWSRAIDEDISITLATGVQALNISLPTSDVHIKAKLGRDRRWVLDRLSHSIAYARNLNPQVAICAAAEDSSRTDPAFLVEYARRAREAGAEMLRFSDTLGVMDPFRTYAAIKMIIEETGITVELHMHNDFGLATANALAGLHAGATWVDASVGGLSDRAGGIALEQISLALEYVAGYVAAHDRSRFTALVNYVFIAAGRTVPENQPIVGANVFSHEAGIHVDGILKDPATYMTFPASQVGAHETLVVGKHSGTAGIKAKLAELGHPVTREEARALLPFVRKKAVQRKRALTDEELLELRCRVMGPDE
jgi:homocitrate synthase NifV